MRRLSLVLAVLALLAAAFFGIGEVRDRDRPTGRDAVETSRVRDWARSEGGAGPSVLPKRVPAADERQLARLEGVPGFHEYAMRCSSCHVLPDPAAYSGGAWVGKVDEMREHIRRAGVVPPPESELAVVRGFLDAASDSLRDGE